MKKKRWAVFAVTAVLLGSILTGCGQGTAATGSGTLKVGVRDDIMNFGYYSEISEKYYGLEIDIANELAKDLGYAQVEFMTVQPENRKELLLNGQVDCLIAAYTISDTRLENFDFSPAYYSDGLRVIVEKSTEFSNISELRNKRIGTMQGTSSGPQFILKLQELNLLPGESYDDQVELPPENVGFEIVQYENYDAVDVALESGEIDAACMDGSIAMAHMNDDRKFIDVEFSPQEYGIATQKGSELSGKVHEAVQKMLDDGTISMLVDKWD